MLLPIVGGGQIVCDFMKNFTATYRTAQEENNTAWELRQGRKEFWSENKALVSLQALRLHRTDNFVMKVVKSRGDFSLRPHAVAPSCR